MVRRLVFSLLLTAGLLIAFRPYAANIPPYRVGDVATNDVVTPVPLVVADPVATALLKEKEKREIRPIFRYCPSLTDQAEHAFRSRMALLREEFIKDYLTPAYGKAKVDKSVERTPKYLELTSRFRTDHKGVPKLFLYMPYWAQGRSDEHLLVDWIGYIRRAMNKPVRADQLPGGIGGPTVSMVTVPDLEMEVQLDHAERYGVLTPVDNIVPLSQARREMAAAFPKDDAYIADFLDPFVRPNCVFDEKLTRLSREQHVDSRIVAVNYVAGEVLVRAGQVIDAKAVAALNELRKQAPEPPPQKEALVPPSSSAEQSNVKPPSGGQTNAGQKSQIEWLIGGICGGALLVACVLLVTRRKSKDLTMVRSADTGFRTKLPTPSREADQIEAGSNSHLARLEGESEREWRERALAAERRAEKARELARSNVTSALKDKVVEHLSTQRDDLIDRQHSAAEQMAGLEARLQQIQGPLSERLRAYEQRIAELEEELALKDEENRALIRAKIQNLRERMAREKAGRAFDMN